MHPTSHTRHPICRQGNSFKPFIFLPVTVLTLLLLTHSAISKTLHNQPQQGLSSFFSGTITDDFTAFERHLTEVFAPSPAKRTAGNTRSRLSDADLITLVRTWHHLSDGFKKVYREAPAFPTDYYSMVSPGGYFQVFYTTNDEFAGIDSIDNYGYGSGGDWRVRNNEPNGIPDYADEVAWALDSSWSMEINGFRFIPPIDTAAITGESGRYRVIIRPPDDDNMNYGITYPQFPLSDSGPGFSSYFEINNDWTLADYRAKQYDVHPEWAVRVTCAHEFFHAIHYAMTWQVVNQVFLDDYPVAWLEGTAVLMEELAFDSVNDYIQYSTDFITTPGMPFLSYTNRDYDYTNGILIKYLYERVFGTPRIDFIFDMFDRHYNKKTTFHNNLQITSGQSGKTWPEILNRFHAESYFTGNRSSEQYFIRDAPLFSKWYYPCFATGTAAENEVTVHPYGMRSFCITPEADNPDTVQLLFSGEVISSDTGTANWKTSVIVRRESGGDTIVSLPTGNDGKGEITFSNWHAVTEAVIVITSGYPDAERQATVELVYNCTEKLLPGDTLDITVVASDKRSSVHVQAVSGSGEFCIPSVREHDRTASPLLNYGDLSPVSSLFSCTYPSSRTDSITPELSVSVFGLSAEQLTDDAALYRCNTAENIWTRLPSITVKRHDTCTFITELENGGIYAILQPEITYHKQVVYPNPVRLHTEEPVRFQFDDIQELRIYRLNGTLLGREDEDTHSSSFYRFTDGILWYPSGHGKSGVTPGTYYAIIITGDEAGLKKPIRKKIIVSP